MIFSFKDVLSHIEQTLINSIKELKKNKRAIKPETALYLFGLALSSFFEDNVSDVNIEDKQVQARLLDSFRLGWKDGITGQIQSQQQIPTEQTVPPEQPGVQVLGGAPVSPDRLGNLPLPGGNVPPPSQTLGGEPPDMENPDEEPPTPIKKPGVTTPEKLDFRVLKRGFINEGKFTGVNLKI